MTVPRRPTPPRGFSLIEILIVVTIIGILAAIAIPRFAGATGLARESSLKTDLQQLRTQLGVYRSQHLELYPGYPGGDPAATPSSSATVDQLTKFTDPYGNTSPTATAQHTIPPLFATAPVNPMNGKSDLLILGPTDPFTATGAHGWLYQPSYGTIKPDSPGADSAGKPFLDY